MPVCITIAHPIMVRHGNQRIFTLAPEGSLPPTCRGSGEFKAAAPILPGFREGTKYISRTSARPEIRYSCRMVLQVTFTDLRLAADSQGDVYAVWIGGDHVYETHCNVSTQPNWNTPTRRDVESDNSASDPSISCTSQGLASGQGLVAISWSQYRSDLGLNAFVSYSQDSGASWKYTTAQYTTLYLKKSNLALPPHLILNYAVGGIPGGIFMRSGWIRVKMPFTLIIPLTLIRRSTGPGRRVFVRWSKS